MGVTLQQLAARPHSPAYLEEAHKKCLLLASDQWPTHTESGRWVDVEGQTGLVYLSMQQERDEDTRPLFDAAGKPIPKYRHGLHVRISL